MAKNATTEISGLPIIEDIKAAILAGKVNPERLSTEWVYQRAWNDALDFAVTQTSRIEKLYSHPNHSVAQISGSIE